MKRLAALLSLALCGTAAQADVVYNWQTLTGHPTVDAFSARIVVSDDAWERGFTRIGREGGSTSASYCSSSVELCGAGLPAGEGPDADFVSIGLSIRSDGENIPGAWSEINLRTGTGYMDRLIAAGGLSLGALLGGSLFFQDNMSELRMSSDGRNVWTLERFNTDNGPSGGGPNCYTGDPLPDQVDGSCYGITGLFVLDRDTLPGEVPLPGTLALMAVAGLGLGAVRRRRAS